jgi:hypothetical protein
VINPVCTRGSHQPTRGTRLGGPLHHGAVPRLPQILRGSELLGGADDGLQAAHIFVQTRPSYEDSQ